MSLTYSARVLQDSISNGRRITTIEATGPRYILAEVNTHTVIQKNSASSRAKPPEHVIQQVRENMFVPETLGSRVKGMGYGADLTPEQLEDGLEHWRETGNIMVERASQFNDGGYDKSRVNRLLEPFMWHTMILTATEWSNFLALRQPATGPVPQHDFPAQPEFQIMARCIADALAASQPEELLHGAWHTPLVSLSEAGEIIHDNDLQIGITEARKLTAKVSSGRCGRVSYDTQHNSEEYPVSLGRHEGFVGSGHWSPAWHPARPIAMDDLSDPILAPKLMVPVSMLQEASERGLEAFDLGNVWCGSYRGWVPLRKTYQYEFDRGEFNALNPEAANA